MNFKEIYQSANDDVKGNREMIDTIFEKAEKKRFALPKFTFTYAVAAVVAFAFCFSIYQSNKLITDEPDKVAVENVKTPDLAEAEISEFNTAEPVIKQPDKNEEKPRIAYAKESVSGKNTDITAPSAEPVTEEVIVEDIPNKASETDVNKVAAIDSGTSMAAGVSGGASGSAPDGLKVARLYDETQVDAFDENCEPTPTSATPSCEDEGNLNGADGTADAETLKNSAEEE